ncbi:MAG: helix-turn-helix domain-containing protein [Candidatus ainarchaeum sp.]|nr:helix-turn-helix domain-containing protein [Candidatus ainarchaeum sp.]
MEGFIIRLEVRHHCMNIESLEKVRDKDARILMKEIKNMSPDGYTHLFELESSKPDDLLDAHRKHPFTKSIDVLAKGGNRITFLMTVKPDIGISHALAKSRCLILGPVVTQEDCDNLTVFAPAWSAFREFMDSLPKDFEVTVKSKRSLQDKLRTGSDSFQLLGFMELETLSEMLTQKQVEILNVAIAKGYYSNPRRITLNELAEHLDIAPATLHEHLSKIESKVMPIISRVLKLF